MTQTYSLILWLTVNTYGGHSVAMSIPLPYESKEACVVAGQEFISTMKDSAGYRCIPATRWRNQ